MLVEIDNLTKTFPIDNGTAGLVALKDVCFSVAEGDFAAILGPSGCGKTTLLRLIAGLDFPTAGCTRFAGEVISSSSRDRGLVFQSYSSFPWLSVAKNIVFGLQHMRLSKKAKEERLGKILSLVGLSEFKNAYPHELSGGMQQRVALGRCLAVEPRLLLLDEPFSAVDAITRRHLQVQLREIVDTVGTTAILVTHDVEEAILLADRILVMTDRPGTIRCESTSPLLGFPSSGRSRESSDFQNLRKQLTAYLEPSIPAEAHPEG